MSEYIAVIRFERAPGMHTLAGTIETLLSGIAGVARVTCDATSSAALVWYDRTAVSLAELVREMEMSGVRVTGIAQSKSDVGVQQSAAIA
jgi:copper chaperone CopZ